MRGEGRRRPKSNALRAARTRPSAPSDLLPPTPPKSRRRRAWQTSWTDLCLFKHLLSGAGLAQVLGQKGPCGGCGAARRLRGRLGSLQSSPPALIYPRTQPIRGYPLSDEGGEPGRPGTNRWRAALLLWRSHRVGVSNPRSQPLPALRRCKLSNETRIYCVQAR